MNPSNETELLSPAGNWDCARAAIAAGADAIFFGLPAFNARLRADNFTQDDLPELMAFLHKHGVKGFLTMNTLIFTGELQAAARQLRLAEEAGVDAFIIQDLGLAQMAARLAPNIEIHASTQMTITAPDGLRFVETILPLKRAVLARELSVKEIGKFNAARETTDPGYSSTPLEVFVHGALCVAYSGQCLTSESLGQRSANRGECAQACRMPYELVVDGVTREMGDTRYLLSPQDLAAVDLIPDLVEAGVKSYKIEGRLKSPEYVAAVTRVYRKALDDAAARTGESQADAAAASSPVSAADRYQLEMTFSRGLSTGWLAGTNHPYLTHGRYGKKRGPFIGTISAIGKNWLEFKPGEQAVPLKPGDGIVIDEGLDRNHEQGGRLFKVEGHRLTIDRLAKIDLMRLEPGQAIHKTADPALESELRKFWKNAKLSEKKAPLHLVVAGRPGLPLTLSSGSISVQSKEALSEASNRPLDLETLHAQLGRLGNTPYELASLENRLEGMCHLPLSQLNALRRELINQLPDDPHQVSPAKQPAESYDDLLPDSTPSPIGEEPKLAVLTRSLEQVEAALECGIETIYCDFEDPRRYREAVALKERSPQSSIFLATPRIIKPNEHGFLKHIASLSPDGLLLRNLAALHYYKDRNEFRKVGDFSLNVANPVTAKLLKESAQLERLTISYDLNINQVLDLVAGTPPAWLELTLHQHMPLFHMEHCVFCTFMSKGTSYKDCGRPCEKHEVHLRDRVGQLHRLHADVGCRNTLFNGRAQTGAAFYERLRSQGLENFRLELLDESRSEALALIRRYHALLKGQTSASELLATLPALSKLGVTEGTLA
ncbi:MAG: U32 family peptidase [Verrucomicrobiota bacterium JB023]|nr:U32 family peptidase [Verrucomicrobiota bacterium JB023]